MLELAYIGIGSNRQNPQYQVEQALIALGELPQTTLLKYSSLYQSAPIGQTGQADYINAVAMLETMLEAHALLDQLQAIERRQGRVRDGTRWGPRTLDLDILLLGDNTIDSQRLTVPHPQIPFRAFVMVPLNELVEANFVLPKWGPLNVLLAKNGTLGVRPLP